VEVTVNVALPASPLVPVTVMVYGPPVVDPTTKDPVRAPLDSEHEDDEINPAVVEEITQPVSDGLKFEPETVTVLPTAAEDALSATVGSTVNEAEAQSPGPGPGQPAAPTISIV